VCMLESTSSGGCYDASEIPSVPAFAGYSLFQRTSARVSILWGDTGRRERRREVEESYNNVR